MTFENDDPLLDAILLDEEVTDKNEQIDFLMSLMQIIATDEPEGDSLLKLCHAVHERMQGYQGDLRRHLDAVEKLSQRNAQLGRYRKQTLYYMELKNRKRDT